MYWTQELLLLQQNNNEKFIQIKKTMRLIFLHFWHYTLLIFKQETIKHRVYGIFFQMHLQQAWTMFLSLDLFFFKYHEMNI